MTYYPAVLSEEQIEEQIERRVAAATERLDRSFMSGSMTHAKYRTRIKELNDWAQRQYELLYS